MKKPLLLAATLLTATAANAQSGYREIVVAHRAPSSTAPLRGGL